MINIGQVATAARRFIQCLIASRDGTRQPVLSVYCIGLLHRNGTESSTALDGDGVACFDVAKTTRYSWHAFSDVSEQAGLIVLWRDRGQGLVVPARVLANDDARRDTSIRGSRSG